MNYQIIHYTKLAKKMMRFIQSSVFLLLVFLLASGIRHPASIYAFTSVDIRTNTASCYVRSPSGFVDLETPPTINIVGDKIRIDAGINTEIKMKSAALYYKKASEPDDKYKEIIHTIPLSTTYKFKDWIPCEIVTTDGVKIYFKVLYSGEAGGEESPPYLIEVIPSVSQTIGPEGGKITLVDANPEDGEVSMEIPKNALEFPVLITFRQKAISEVPEGFGVATVRNPVAAYEILPENIKFNKEYKLTLLYFDFDETDGDKIDGTAIAEDDLKTLWWDNFDWRLVGSKLNKDNNTIESSLIHTSLYAIFPAQLGNFTRPKEKIITPGLLDGKNDYAYFDGLTDTDDVSIKIYDITGRKIRDIDSAPYRWDGKNNDGRIVESGTYIYQYKYDGKKFNGVIVVAK